MTLTASIALFSTMLVLAMIPGPGVFVVVSRSLSGGLASGLAAAFGIVLGDYVFIILSVFGLVAVADAMGNLFVVIRYLGIAYLIFLGVRLLRTKTPETDPQTLSANAAASGLGSAVSVGLMTTLANPKAILFYLSFFPAFLDLTTVSIPDVLIILLLATLAFGGVMAAYALLASRAQSGLRSPAANRAMNITSGSILLSGGIWLAAKA